VTPTADGVSTVVTVASSGWTDHSSREAAVGASIIVKYDNTVPTVAAISSASTFWNSSPIDITVVFSEGVYGFPKACDEFVGSDMTLVHSNGGGTVSAGVASTGGQVRLRDSWVTLRARWVTLRARWVTLRARWVTLRARWVTLRARSLGDAKSSLGDAKSSLAG
jgi:hypothetical protein